MAVNGERGKEEAGRVGATSAVAVGGRRLPMDDTGKNITQS